VGAWGGEVEQFGDDVGGRAGLVPDDGGAGFVAAAGDQRVVLAVDEHGLDVAGTDAGGLQGGDLAFLVAVSQEGEPGAAQVTDSVKGLARVERLRMERRWRRAPG